MSEPSRDLTEARPTPWGVEPAPAPGPANDLVETVTAEIEDLLNRRLAEVDVRLAALDRERRALTEARADLQRARVRLRPELRRRRAGGPGDLMAHVEQVARALERPFTNDEMSEVLRQEPGWTGKVTPQRLCACLARSRNLRRVSRGVWEVVDGVG